MSELRKTFLAVGGFILIVGIFLPWKCYGDIVRECQPGISWFIFRYQAIPNSFSIVALAIIACFVVLQIKVLEKWRGEIIFTSIILTLIYVLEKNMILEDNGGLVLLGLSFMILWSHFRLSNRKISIHFCQILLILQSVWILYHFFLILPIVRAEQQVIGATEFGLGIVLLFLGNSLMIMAVGILRKGGKKLIEGDID